MKTKMLSVLLGVAFFCCAAPASHAAPQSKLGEHFKMLETQKAQKEKELQRLKDLAKTIENEIGSIKAEMARKVTTTVEKVGRLKANSQGFVTTSGGVVNSFSKHWSVNEEKLRKEYEQAGIYTSDEIYTIVEFHKSYAKNQGFTAGIAEELAKIAEATAQQRTLKKYISRKKDEITELENAINGTSAGDAGAGGGGSGGGGGGGGGGGSGY